MSDAQWPLPGGFGAPEQPTSRMRRLATDLRATHVLRIFYDGVRNGTVTLTVTLGPRADASCPTPRAPDSNHS